MDIITIPLSEIKPAEYNPRKDLTPRNAEYKKIERSIEEFGLVQPLVWNKRSGNLVGGHQRYKVLQAQGLEFVQVSVVDLPQGKEKALNLALNKISGQWDEDALFDVIQDLVEDDEFDIVDLDLTGFDTGETDAIIEDLLKRSNGEETFDVDAALEADRPIVTQPGDLIELGKHRLLCSTCLDNIHVTKLLNGRKAAACITDPPYNVGMKYEDKYSDHQERDEYAAFSEQWFNNARKHSDCLVFTPGTGKRLANFSIWFQIEIPKWIAIWVKTNSTTHSPIGGFQAWEPLFIYGDLPKRVGQDVYIVPITNQYTNNVALTDLHPTPKQVKLWSALISDFSQSGDIIYEPFSGSGTSFISCEILNRRCFGIEIEPKYCDVIVRRYIDYVGEQNVDRELAEKYR